ncbi:MAG: DegT/DnrJ/EryC1/StrS family aminotransferase [Bdellovibrionales bacterium]|nr:DegT/DnrJ/EryC1/StrS family aminotransferase [Bdellovibrionales bacterium]
MKFEFIDLASQQTRIKDSLDKRMQAVLKHGQYIMGPEIAELEAQLAEYVGTKHCISLSSGTDALLVAMMALDIHAGDEVITTPFTFYATGEMIALLGAKPVFVDIDPETYNMDPALVEKAITSRTKAIVPVSLYGQCADFDALNAIGKKHKIPVIEDAAQSFGGTYKGRKSCALSEMSCTSFFPSKPLGGYGDSGACFTNDDKLAQRMREIRVHGQPSRYYHTMLGINGRMDTLQAAILLAKMEVFPEEVAARERIGARYTQLIDAKLGRKAITPVIRSGNTSPYAQYTVQIEHRNEVQEKLKKLGVPTAVHYPIPLHLQPVFKYLELGEGSFPEAEAAGKRVMSLPMHPYLTEKDQTAIVSALAEAIG